MLTAFLASAQKNPITWNFGFQASLVFEKETVKPGPTSKIGKDKTENEPAAAMYGAKGELIAYTNGVSIWDAKHNLITDSLTGTTSIAQVAVAPIPGTNRFYVFHADGGNDDVSSWKYSEFKYDDALKVEKVKLNTVLSKGHFVQAVTIVRHCNMRDFWVVIKSAKANSKTYESFLIDPKGIGEKTSSKGKYAMPAGGGGNYHVIARMKSSFNHNMLATAFYANGSGGIELVEFDNSTGQVTKPIALLKAFYDRNSVYGVEFSPDDNYIYATESIDKSLCQFDISSKDHKTINKSYKSIGRGATEGLELGGIQAGPDGKLYVSNYRYDFHSSGCTYIGVIENPEMEGKDADWNAYAICLPADQSMHTGFGLPSMIRPATRAKCEIPAPEPEPEVVIEEPKEEPKTLAKAEKGDTVVLNNINFLKGSFNLQASSKTILDDFAQTLKDKSEMKIEIHGHTDNQGSENNNLTLSEKRAKSVLKYLVSKGIDAGRLSSKGFGESTPKTSNDSVEGRALNRRVEFIVK